MQYFLTVNKPIPLTPLLREYFNPLIIWPLVLIPLFRLSVEARIRYYTCCILNCWYMYTYPYIHSSNENSRVDSSRSSSQAAWLAESQSAFTRILTHQPPGQLPLPYPRSREVVRMSCNRGPAPLSGRKQRAEKPILSFPCHPSLPPLPSPLFSGPSFPFFSLPLSSQETSPPPQPPDPKVFPFYGLESNVLEVMVKIKI